MIATFFFNMLTQPPNIPDDKLFRMMLVTPRPKKLLKFSIMDIPLYVQAITSSEVFDINSKDLEFTADYINQALRLKDGSRVFSSGSKIINTLTSSEFQSLSSEVYEVLSEISPLFHLCDYEAWRKKLTSGANHNSNYMIRLSLGSCVSFTLTSDRIINHDHPERYFNIPRNELLDCHWMAYFAARDIYIKNAFKPFNVINDESAFLAKNKDTLDTALKDNYETR